MRLLLDTHVFLWVNNEYEKLSSSVTTAFQDSNNQIFLSLVSIWEVQIKQQLGKLELKTPLMNLLQWHCNNNSIQLLPIQLSHILGLQELPAYHKDPYAFPRGSVGTRDERNERSRKSRVGKSVALPTISLLHHFRKK